MLFWTCLFSTCVLTLIVDGVGSLSRSSANVAAQSANALGNAADQDALLAATLAVQAAGPPMPTPTPAPVSVTLSQCIPLPSMLASWNLLSKLMLWGIATF